MREYRAFGFVVRLITCTAGCAMLGSFLGYILEWETIGRYVGAVLGFAAVIADSIRSH